jgi:hypothetical protein
MIGCIIFKPVNFLDWRSCFIGFMSWCSHCSYENSGNGDMRTLLWIYTIRWTHVSIYINVNIFLKTALFHYTPYIFFVIDKKVFFLALMLVEMLENYVSNHTRKDQFVPVYSMTACWGSICIPAFILNLRTTLICLIRLQPPPIY